MFWNIGPDSFQIFAFHIWRTQQEIGQVHTGHVNKKKMSSTQLNCHILTWAHWDILQTSRHGGEEKKFSEKYQTNWLVNFALSHTGWKKMDKIKY